MIIRRMLIGQLSVCYIQQSGFSGVFAALLATEGDYSDGSDCETSAQAKRLELGY